MDYETLVETTRSDRIAAAAVRGLEGLGRNVPAEYVLQSIAKEAEGDADAVVEARKLDWVLALESSSDFQYVARAYNDDKPLAPGSRRRVLDLLFEAERRIRGV